MSLRRFHDFPAVGYVVLAAILVTIPIFILGIPNGADLPNHYRFALPFYDSIRGGSWYPGWLAESNAGYGDPRFRFYPPAFYYLLVLFRSLTGSWYFGTLGTFLLISITGGVGLYFWVRQLSSDRVAMWAGILYAFAPYRLNEVYQASLLSEYAACSVLPFTFAFAERVCRKRHAADIAGLAISFALLVLTSLPLAVIGSLSLGIYALLRLKRPGWRSQVFRLSVGFALGLLASAFFWTTVVAELPWIKGSSVNPNVYYNYRANFVFSSAALTNRNTWFANILALAVLAFISPAVVLLRRELRKEMSKTLKAVFAFTLFSFLMTTEVSRPVWAIVPKLQEVQFPWRWLSMTSLFGCILLASSIPQWLQYRITDLRPRDLVAPLALVLSLVFIVAHIVGDSLYLSKQQFDSMLPEIRGAVSFKDWIPISAREVREMNPMKDRVAADLREVHVELWQPEHREFWVSTGPETQLRVRTYFYPLWSASSNGRRLTTRADEDGALLIDVPADASTVKLSLEEPSRVQITRIVSGIGLSLIILVYVFGFVRTGFRKRELTTLVRG